VDENNNICDESFNHEGSATRSVSPPRWFHSPGRMDVYCFSEAFLISIIFVLPAYALVS
jgi:hypothetical protein